METFLHLLRYFYVLKFYGTNPVWRLQALEVAVVVESHRMVGCPHDYQETR